MDNIDPFKDKFIVVTEHDHHDHTKSGGPIAIETYINTHGDLPSAIQIADRFKHLGDATIYKLVPVGDPLYCRELVEQDIKMNRRRKF